jgi:hypothetical protein
MSLNPKRTPGLQLDAFVEPIGLTDAAKGPASPSKEGLRNGHIVAHCGVAAFEYLVAYATQRGMKVGPATKAGKAQQGKLVSLLIVKKQVVRACYALDIAKAKPKFRRLSAKRFTRLVDAFAAKKKGVAA